MARRAILALALMLGCLMLGWARAANAAGGAHVVDDSEVETPGLCHFENWVSFESGHSQFANAGPGCTSREHSNLELGGYVSYQRQPGPNDTTIGLDPKFELRPVNAGFGLAVDGAVGFGLRRHRFETASIVIPFSVAFTPLVQFNLNAGANWTRADHSMRAFTGGQIVGQISPTIQLMAESFNWSGRPLGGQAGVRWTVDDGRIDLDLLAGRYVDGSTKRAVTLGFTIRR